MNPFNGNTQFRYGNRRGQSLTELAILLPFFVTLILGTVEYSNMFMTSLRASNLSREIANASFRDCAPLDDAALVTCLSANAGKVSTEGALILNDFLARGAVIASAYARDLDESPAVRLAGTETAGGGAFQSRYNVNLVDENLVNQHDRIVIGEIIYPYTPITPLRNFLALLNIRAVIYEVTIY